MGLTRSHRAERLDDLTVHGPDHERVLRELAQINRWSATTARVVRAVRSLPLSRRPTIVDIGCGGGDLLAALRRVRPEARLIGIDGNPATIAVARRTVDAEFIEADIVDPAFVAPPCDLAVSTHFLYHLPDGSLRDFIDRQQAKSWVIAELRRSRVAAAAFGLLGRPLLSQWTVADGVQAVRRSYTLSELRAELGPDWTIRPGPFEMIASRSSPGRDIGRPSAGA